MAIDVVFVVETAIPLLTPHVVVEAAALAAAAAAAICDFANDVTISVFTPFGVLVIVTFTNVVFAIDVVVDNVAAADGDDDDNKVLFGVVAAVVVVFVFDIDDIDDGNADVAVVTVKGVTVVAIVKAGVKVTDVVATAETDDGTVIDIDSVDGVVTDDAVAIVVPTIDNVAAGEEVDIVVAVFIDDKLDVVTIDFIVLSVFI